MYHRRRNIFGIVVLGVMVVWIVAVGIHSMLYEQSQPATVSYTGGSVHGSANGSWSAPQSGSSATGLGVPQVSVSSQRPRSAGSYHSPQSSLSSGNYGGASYAGGLHTSSSQRVHSVGGGGYAGGAVSYSSSSRRATPSVSSTYTGGGYSMPMIVMNNRQRNNSRSMYGSAQYNPLGNRHGTPAMRRAGEVTGDPTANPGVGGGVSGNGYVGGNPSSPGINYNPGYVTGDPTNPGVTYNPGYATGDPLDNPNIWQGNTGDGLVTGDPTNPDITNNSGFVTGGPTGDPIIDPQTGFVTFDPTDNPLIDVNNGFVTGDPTDNPNIVPLGDGLWILAIMSARYYIYRRRRKKLLHEKTLKINTR